MTDDTKKFPGFPPEMRKNFWMYPRIMDAYWHDLSGSEQKCLDFILRRTWGWEKTTDRISLSQIERGGGGIGLGSGLSQRQIITAVKELEKKGYIRVSRDKGKTNEFSLVVQEVHRSQEETATGTNEPNAKAGDESSKKIAYTLDNIPIDKAIEQIYTLYSKIIRPGMRLTSEAKKNLADRFGEYHPELLVKAMKKVRDDDYWGEIAEKNTIAWFFASEERIATFLALDPYEE